MAWSVAVYCGSRMGDSPLFVQAARQVGELIARSGGRLVYGGGKVGLMGAGADAALAAGGASTDKPKPTALESYSPQIAGRQVWSTRLDKLDFPMVPTVREGELTLASGNGNVVTLQADTGA